MGEIIKSIAKGKLIDSEVEIELNHPPVSGLDEQIHIQTDKFRFEMDKKDYIKYALSVLVAEKNFKNLKGLK